jgi:hypothetical protein
VVIGSIIRIAGFLALILAASIVTTLLPDIFRILELGIDRSYSSTRSADSPAARFEKDPQLAAIEEAARRTSPEGCRVIEKALLARPEFERRVGAKSVKEMIEHARMAEGLNRIEPLGWEASRMKEGGWRLTFHYHRWPSLYMSTEWEYDERVNRLRLLDSRHGAEFWARVASLP